MFTHLPLTAAVAAILALIVLLAIPWTLAVAQRLASESDRESERGDDAAPET